MREIFSRDFRKGLGLNWRYLRIDEKIVRREDKRCLGDDKRDREPGIEENEPKKFQVNWRKVQTKLRNFPLLPNGSHPNYLVTHPLLKHQVMNYYLNRHQIDCHFRF